MQFRNQVSVVIVVLSLLLGASWIYAQNRSTDALSTITSSQAVPVNYVAAKKKMWADADIQKCIDEKFGDAKLKDEGISAKVSSGEAVLSGETRTPGHKGNAASIAKGCGARKVTNHIITRNPPVH